MVQVTVSEVQQHLPEIIDGLLPGEEVEIFQDGCLVARLFGESKKSFVDNNLTYDPESPRREVVRLVRFRFTGEMESLPYDFDDEGYEENE